MFYFSKKNPYIIPFNSIFDIRKFLIKPIFFSNFEKKYNIRNFRIINFNLKKSKKI